MQTKLGIFCDKLIEAGWLAAVIVTPLFFNSYSHGSFEFSKVTLLRSIALVMALAWIVRFIEEGGLSKPSVQWRQITSSNPLAVSALIMAGVYILTTITSVVPRTSFWGAYVRPQGTYTILSYVVIFFLMCHSLRTRGQLERLIFVLLLTSLPVSLYGIMQHDNLDPLSGVTENAALIRSTMGNPIPLAGYLIMVVPLTWWRLLDSVSALLHGKGKGISTSLLAGCHTLLLAAQLICILFTQSRGPVIGLVGGVFFLLVLLAIAGNRKGLTLAVTGATIVFILFLIFFNLPDSPLASLRDAPYIGRLGEIFESAESLGRVLIWQGVIEMATDDPWRTLLGYGPDSMFVAYNKFYPAELVQYELGERPDRSHNQSFDALVTTGLIGLAAYILLFTSIFYYGLKALGLIRSRRQGVTFVTLWLLGGGLGVLIPRLLEGTWRLAGMGLSLGFVAALAAYLVAQALFCNPASQKPESSWRRRLLTALFSALVAHFIEIQSGIAVTATLTYFWIYAALLVIVGYLWPEEPSIQAVVAASPAETSSRRRVERRKQRRTASRPTGAPWSSTILSSSLLMGLILMTTGFDFINYQFQLAAGGSWILGLIAVVWLLGGTIIVACISERKASSPGSRGVGSSVVTYGLISLGWFLVFIVLYTAAIHPGADLGNTVVVYYLFLLLAMMAIAAVLMSGTATRLRFWRRSSGWLYPILSLVVVVLIFVTNLSVVRADIYFKVGLALREAERYDESIALYRRALALAPHQDRYYLFMGLDSMAKMETASSAEQESYWFEESKEALEKAQEISPLDPDHPANLGTLYLRWAGMAAGSAERVKRLERALEYYQQAAAMSPHHHGFRLQSDVLQIHLLLGDLYIAMGELDQAVAVYEKARGVDPDDYRSHKGLAIVYQRLGRFDEALNEAERARDLAPSGEKGQIDELITHLKAQGL